MTRTMSLSIVAAVMAIGLSGGAVQAQAHARQQCEFVKKCHGPFFHRRCETIRVCHQQHFRHDHHDWKTEHWRHR
jgi:hypothetical protein